MAKVCKFGGSSLADRVAVERALTSVSQDKDRRFVVVSAPGKRFEGDEKVTDMLIRCHEALEKRRKTAFDAVFLRIRERFEPFKFWLAPHVVDELLEEVKRCVQEKTDYAFTLSRGEYLTARLFSKVLEVPFVDTYCGLRLSGGLPERSSFEPLGKKLRRLERAVLPGFYGNEGGAVALMPRGGGDITGSVVARCVRAELYENFTDVDGVLSADPKLVPSAKTVPVLSRRELKTLSRSGASVFEEHALSPLVGTGIPVAIQNAKGNAKKTLVLSGTPVRVTPAGVAGKTTGEKGFVTVVGTPVADIVGTLKDAGIQAQTVYQGKTTVRCAVKKEAFLAALRAVHDAFQWE